MLGGGLTAIAIGVGSAIPIGAAPSLPKGDDDESGDDPSSPVREAKQIARERVSVTQSVRREMLRCEVDPFAWQGIETGDVIALAGCSDPSKDGVYRVDYIHEDHGVGHPSLIASMSAVLGVPKQSVRAMRGVTLKSSRRLIRAGSYNPPTTQFRDMENFRGFADTVPDRVPVPRFDEWLARQPKTVREQIVGGSKR